MIGVLFGGAPYGIGLLTAGIILAIMVLPFITSITRDVFQTVPTLLRESAYGMGMTTWEVVRSIIIPYCRVGLVGGIMLGLGRALGETMAVTFVIGNSHNISPSLLAPATTISATIANEFTEATGDLYTSSLIELGLILFVITFVVLGARQMDAGPRGSEVRSRHGQLLRTPRPQQSRHGPRRRRGRGRTVLPVRDPRDAALQGLHGDLAAHVPRVRRRLPATMAA